MEKIEGTHENLSRTLEELSLENQEITVTGCIKLDRTVFKCIIQTKLMQLQSQFKFASRCKFFSHDFY